VKGYLFELIAPIMVGGMETVREYTAGESQIPD